MTLVTLAFALPYPLECGQPCEYDGVPLLDLWQKRLADIISPKSSDLRKWSYLGGPGLITGGLLNLGPWVRRGRSQRFKAWEGIDPPLLDWRWRSHMVRCRWHLGAESGPWLIGNQATVTSVLQARDWIVPTRRVSLEEKFSWESRWELWLILGFQPCDTLSREPSHGVLDLTYRIGCFKLLHL